MSMMVVQQRVEDFDKWKKIFDAAFALRKANGEQSCRIFRNTADPNQITLVFEWDDLQNALKYSQNKLFKEAARKAGVLGEPLLYLPAEGLDD